METNKSLESPVKLKPSEQQLSKKFEELYNQSSRKKQKLLQIKEEREREKCEKELKQCTFHPKVNPDPVFHGSNPSSFIKREQDWLNRKQKRIEEMAKQSQTKGIQGCSFRPMISAKSIEILQNPTKFTPKEKKVDSNNSKTTKNSYREIYKRKQSQKNGGGIFLMTQKRSQIRKNNQESQQHRIDENKLAISRRKQLANKSEVKGSESFAYQQIQQAQKIHVKAEEQDTFNSVSSMEIKTERNQQSKQQKPRIMILDGQIQDHNQQATSRSNFTEENLIERKPGQNNQTPQQASDYQDMHAEEEIQNSQQSADQCI